jgi:hypothetical protein
MGLFHVAQEMHPGMELRADGKLVIRLSHPYLALKANSCFFPSLASPSTVLGSGPRRIHGYLGEIGG